MTDGSHLELISANNMNDFSNSSVLFTADCV